MKFTRSDRHMTEFTPRNLWMETGEDGVTRFTVTPDGWTPQDGDWKMVLSFVGTYETHFR